jgi:hypothetical protein
MVSRTARVDYLQPFEKFLTDAGTQTEVSWPPCAKMQHSPFAGSLQSLFCSHKAVTVVFPQENSIFVGHIASHVDVALSTGQFGKLPEPVLTRPQQTLPPEQSDAFVHCASTIASSPESTPAPELDPEVDPLVVPLLLAPVDPELLVPPELRVSPELELEPLPASAA